jgi:hypothetical protein
MWDPQHPTTLQACTACYEDNFTFYISKWCSYLTGNTPMDLHGLLRGELYSSFFFAAGSGLLQNELHFIVSVKWILPIQFLPYKLVSFELHLPRSPYSPTVPLHPHAWPLHTPSHVSVWICARVSHYRSLRESCHLLGSVSRSLVCRPTFWGVQLTWPISKL